MNKINHIKFEKITFDAIICIDGDLPDLDFFTKLKSIPKIAADGAANSLIRIDIIPDYVIGDLDSVNEDLLADFSSEIKLIKDEDQNKNDFEKALILSKELEFENILIVGFHGGELEHTMNNLSVFKKYSKSLNLVVFDLYRYGFLLQNHNLIHVAKDEIISLIPQPKALLSTEHLQWNLKKEWLEIGEREGARNRSLNDEIIINVIEGEVMIFCQERLPFVPEKFEQNL